MSDLESRPYHGRNAVEKTREMMSLDAIFDESGRLTTIMLEGRPTIPVYYLAIATVAASRSTCRRRAVGCVLIDKNDRVLAIGYNGAPRGFPHCIDHPCPGADRPSGDGLDACEAVHAEQSALVTCRAISDIATAIVTVSPCVSCTKLLLNTPCMTIAFGQPYAATHMAAQQLWERAGRAWIPLCTDLSIAPAAAAETEDL